MVLFDGWPDMGEAGYSGEIIFMDKFDCGIQFSGTRAVRRNVFSARNFTKVFFDIGFGFRDIKITRNCDGHIIWDIPARIEILRVL